MAETPLDRIRAYYDRDPDREWSRLDRHPLEFPVTLAHLDRFLAPGPLAVLDVGAGPGRYSLALARQGRRVTLVDLSPANVAAARRRADGEGLVLEACRTGDARDLSPWADGSFDAVLLMGPLYHLAGEDDRRKAVSEAFRVLRAGGVAVFSFISRYAAAFDAVKHLPGEERLSAAQAQAMVDRRTNASHPDDPGFTDAWFADPAEVGPWVAARGFEVLTVFGAEGPLAQSDQRLGPPEGRLFQEWLAFARATAATPAGLFGSEHVVVVARKSAPPAREAGCPFCRLNGRPDTEALVYEDDRVVAAVALHQKPGQPGSLVVCPRNHHRDLYSVPEADLQAVVSAARRLAVAVKAALGADGVTLVQNNDPAGDQEVFHLHWHVVPRYEGDRLDPRPREVAPLGDRRRWADLIRATLKAQETP